LKRYVQQKTVKTVDEEELQVIQVYESKRHSYSYIVFLEKQSIRIQL
jgi:hypothetical protein